MQTDSNRPVYAEVKLPQGDEWSNDRLEGGLWIFDTRGNNMGFSLAGFFGGNIGLVILTKQRQQYNLGDSAGPYRNLVMGIVSGG
ncbi:MAG: hypothetical protein OXC40_01485 [Proteobacteria bacterium]|nr:hypothetical protein [Pseudomonadota bacterium]